MAFEKKIALPGSQRELVAGASAARPIDNNEVVQATVVLRRRTQTPAPESFAFSDPQTANHHPREDYGLIHGASPADIASIEAFAHEYGLTVTERSQARRSVVLSGTAENMQQAFGTKLAHYDSPRGSYRGRTGPVMVPQELQPMIAAVLGLDNRPIAKPHLRMHASQPPGSLTPVQIAHLYNFPTSVNGAGPAKLVLTVPRSM